MTVGSWKAEAQKCIDIQQASIPKQWLLSKDQLPSTDRLDITNIPYECGILSAKELEMTEQDGASLLRKYESGEWTAEEVTIAFLKRTTIGQQLLNFATEILAESALETAKKLDAYFKETGKLFGPLHGIPISVKEHVSMGGLITHAGFVSKISVAEDDAHVVKLLKKAGAILHVRTNQPQSLMHLDCSNNITGTTFNPYNLKLSPGGSSGGEGASMGFKCAVMGVGTDIGGSIRCPAAFNNSYGLRPTALRNPALGLQGLGAGQESIRGVLGPLSQSVGDITLFQKAVLDQKPWDVETSLVPLPWRDIKENKNITVAVMKDDGIVRPHPPVVRALEHTAQKLKAAGINVVDWEPFKHDHGWEIVSALYFPDAGRRYRAEFAKTGEPELPLTTHAINFSSSEPLTVDQNRVLNFTREAYRRDYHALMKERGVDFILCPAYVGAGVLLEGAKYWNYTAIWNILDQPATVFPSGLRVDKELDLFDQAYTPRNAQDEAEWKAYDPELFHGLPVALQLAGKHYHDEEVVEATRMIDEIIKS